MSSSVNAGKQDKNRRPYSHTLSPVTSIPVLLWCFARRARRPPDAQFWRCDEMCVLVPPGDALKKQLGGLFSKQVGGLIDRGERQLPQIADARIVVARN